VKKKAKAASRKKPAARKKPAPSAAAPAPAKAPSGPPQALSIGLGALAELAVEWWRLERWAVDDSKLVGRHVARRVARFLEDQGLEVVDLTGKPYEAGLAVEVVETLDDPAAPEGGTIEEVVSPIVMWKGTVVRQGQVVMKKRAA
jgi:hypothetical protein